MATDAKALFTVSVIGQPDLAKVFTYTEEDYETDKQEPFRAVSRFDVVMNEAGQYFRKLAVNTNYKEVTLLHVEKCF